MRKGLIDRRPSDDFNKPVVAQQATITLLPVVAEFKANFTNEASISLEHKTERQSGGMALWQNKLMVVWRLELLTRHTCDALLKATSLSLPTRDERQTTGRPLNPIYSNLTLLLFTGHDGSVPAPPQLKCLMGPPITLLSYDTQWAWVMI